MLGAAQGFQISFLGWLYLNPAPQTAGRARVTAQGAGGFRWNCSRGYLGQEDIITLLGTCSKTKPSVQRWKGGLFPNPCLISTSLIKLSVTAAFFIAGTSFLGGRRSAPWGSTSWKGEHPTLTKPQTGEGSDTPQLPEETSPEGQSGKIPTGKAQKGTKDEIQLQFYPAGKVQWSLGLTGHGEGEIPQHSKSTCQSWSLSRSICCSLHHPPSL